MNGNEGHTHVYQRLLQLFAFALAYFSRPTDCFSRTDWSIATSSITAFTSCMAASAFAQEDKARIRTSKAFSRSLALLEHFQMANIVRDPLPLLCKLLQMFLPHTSAPLTRGTKMKHTRNL